MTSRLSSDPMATRVHRSAVGSNSGTADEPGLPPLRSIGTAVSGSLASERLPRRGKPL